MPMHIQIVEVGPRDGLQNETVFIPTKIKLQFIEALAASGLSAIEATSFVSPKWVPQMQDHTEIMQALNLSAPIRYPVLIPNLRGLESALNCGVKDIAVFTSASESFSQHNTNCSIAQSLATIVEIISVAKAEKLNIRAYLSCTLGCPYEKQIAVSNVANITHQLYQMGIAQIALSDTIGIGTKESTDNMIQHVLTKVPAESLAVHFHDTQHRALENIAVALNHGITTIDSAAGGLGGCPYAPGASGNVSTESVIDFLHQQGLQCDVDKNKIRDAHSIIKTFIANHQ